MAVRPEYRFRIAVTYTKTAADNAEIAADDLADKKWKNAYTAFKSLIRNHLKLQQNGRCAFCRCRVSIGTSYSNLEHLVSKTDYPQFKTLPANLVYCCWLCNKSKNKKNTINNPVADKTQQTFPTTTNDFTIVNPYHDNYASYIDFIDDIIIVKRGTSIKGPNTIEYYDLTRPELAEERAREFKLNQNKLHHQLLARLTDATTPPNILLQINNIINQMPNWTITN